MSNRPDSNVLFNRHLPEMRSSLQLDGFSLYLVQRGLLTERDVIFLHSLEGGDLQCCHLVRLLKKTRNAFESFVEALEEEVASDYSANAHGHGQLLENMRGSLAALQNMQPPRSRSGSLLGVPEADTPARSPSPFSSVIVRRSGTAGSDSSVVSSRQSPTPSVSPEPSPLPKSDSFGSISTADSLKALGDLAQKVLSENWELREALGHKSRECEELRQELAKLQVKKPTRIPVPLVHTRSGHSWEASEGCLCADQVEVLQGRGLQRPNTAAPSFRAASPCWEGKGPSKLPPIFH